jgi:hypothetical protein
VSTEPTNTNKEVAAEAPQRGTALAVALAAIARLSDVGRPRNRVLYRRSAPQKACSQTYNTETS